MRDTAVTEGDLVRVLVDGAWTLGYVRSVGDDRMIVDCGDDTVSVPIGVTERFVVFVRRVKQ